MAGREIVEEKRQAMLDILLNSIKNNPTRWERGWVAVDVPYNGVTQKNYNGINAVFLDAVADLKEYNDKRWVTFNQAKDLGVKIKAGEKASEVFFWSRYDIRTKKQFDVSSIKGLSEDQIAAYMKENVKPILKYFHVFNVCQCNEFPKPTRANTMSEKELTRQNSLIENVIDRSEAPINYDGGLKAYYSPMSDDIHLPLRESFKSMNDFYATTLHEISHSTGHPTRLNRDLTSGFGSPEYAIEELRAELSSVFLQAEFGINLGNAQVANHGAYLASWLSVVKEDKNLFYKAAGDASKITDYIGRHYMTSENTTALNKNQAMSSFASMARSIQMRPRQSTAGKENLLFNENVND